MRLLMALHFHTELGASMCNEKKLDMSGHD